MFKKVDKYRSVMQSARDYDTWKEAALELDYLENKVEWRETFASDIYNYELVYDRLKLLKSCRERGDYDELSRELREGLHHDLGNMGDLRLYNVSHFGTKHLIEEYVNQVCECLDHVCDRDIQLFNTRSKLQFFKDTLLSFGRPALLLSGGASLGMFHLGVVKSLWEQGLLPQVINGSSVGSLVAAMLGTHTDDEIPAMLVPEKHNLKAWRWMGLINGFKGRGVMDQKQLEDCIRSNIGELTFQEAYERSGRSINITVSPVYQHQIARLLSGYTSPYLTVWSACLASCAVPFIFPPVKLVKKNTRGENVPYMPRLRWVDGSVVSDLPIERLKHLYDINFTIVSQTNPHIVPFLRDQRKTEKHGLLNLPVNILKSEFKFRGRGVFDYLRHNVDSEILRQMSGHAYKILSQNYYGDATIAPRYKLRHYTKMLSNPTPEFVKEMMLEGERATWPKLSMIRTHSKISKTLERCIDRLKKRLDNKQGQLTVVAR